MTTMKTRDIRSHIRTHGFDAGVMHILEIHNEQIRELRKIVVEQAGMISHMVDTISNVVNGAHGMKLEFERQMKKAGLAEPGDDFNVSTQSIGDEETKQ